MIFVLGTTVALTGCTSSSDNEVREEESTELDSDAKNIVEQYYTAEDVESINKVLHPESRRYPHEEDDFIPTTDFTINQSEQVSIREVIYWEAEQSGEQLTDEEIDARIEVTKEAIEATEFEDISFILISAEFENETDEVVMTVVNDDGEWYVYPDLSL